jgi:hypothetical protein
MRSAKTYSVARFYRLSLPRADALVRKVVRAAAGRCDACLEPSRTLLLHLYPDGSIRGVICPRDYRRVRLNANSRDHYLSAAYLAQNHPREPIETLLAEVKKGR